jgi:DNA-binding GntR family transcriptional regulator
VDEPPEIDYRGTLPPYQQVAAWLRDLISSGRLQPGQVLPSEKELMDSTGLARITIRKAMRVLRDEGHIFTIPQRGSYVTRR